MRVLNRVSGSSTWLFEVADLNPKGKSIFPDILEWLKDTYSFKKAPESVTDLDENKGLTFENGEFQAKEEVFVTVQLKLFNDGLVARTSSSTEDADKFLDNVVQSAAAEFSLTFDPGMVRRRLYLSELIVRMDTPLENLNPKLVAFAEKLSSLFEEKKQWEVGGISFWTDSTYAVTKISPFSLERKINAPFDENRFYSKAALQSEQHISMLKELEDILRGAAQPLRGIVS
jgi:hypothetical protein